MPKLNRKKLEKEKRFGLIEISFDVLFDLEVLNDYIIPVDIISVDNLQERFTLNCLSKYFETVDDLRTICNYPKYKATIYSQEGYDFIVQFDKLES